MWSDKTDTAPGEKSKLDEGSRQKVKYKGCVCVSMTNAVQKWVNLKTFFKIDESRCTEITQTENEETSKKIYVLIYIK